MKLFNTKRNKNEERCTTFDYLMFNTGTNYDTSKASGSHIQYYNG
jgi:hypothetical protein